MGTTAADILQVLSAEALRADLGPAIVTLFVTIDPIGLVPIVAALTVGASPAETRAMALRGVLIAGGIIVAFIFLGSAILDALGIGLPAFRIAGGILLFWIAFEMVFETRTDRAFGADAAPHPTPAVIKAPHAPSKPVPLSTFAAVPLAIPLIAGPGTLTAALLLSAPTTVAPDPAIPVSAIGQLTTLLATAIVLTLTYCAIATAPWIKRALGETGCIVLARLLGVVLAALSVQFVIDGVVAILPQPA